MLELSGPRVGAFQIQGAGGGEVVTHREAVLEGRDEAEWLCGRPRVPAALDGEVELIELEGQAGSHHLHGAREVVDHRDGTGRTARVGLGVGAVIRLLLLEVGEEGRAGRQILLVGEKRKPVVEDLVRHALEAEIDRRVDLETATAFAFRVVGRASEDRLLAFLECRAEERELVGVEKLLLDLGDDVFRRPATDRCVDDPQGLLLGALRFSLGDPAFVRHLVDHLVAAIQGDLGSHPRVVQARVAHLDGEGGRLVDLQVLQRLCQELSAAVLTP